MASFTSTSAGQTFTSTSITGQTFTSTTPACVSGATTEPGVCPPLFAKITGFTRTDPNSDPGFPVTFTNPFYSWTEVVPTGGGGWAPGSRSGSMAENLNQPPVTTTQGANKQCPNISPGSEVPNGTIVRLRAANRSSDGTCGYAFEYCCLPPPKKTCADNFPSTNGAYLSTFALTLVLHDCSDDSLSGNCTEHNGCCPSCWAGCDHAEIIPIIDETSGEIVGYNETYPLASACACSIDAANGTYHLSGGCHWDASCTGRSSTAFVYLKQPSYADDGITVTGWKCDKVIGIYSGQPETTSIELFSNCQLEVTQPPIPPAVDPPADLFIYVGTVGQAILSSGAYSAQYHCASFNGLGGGTFTLVDATYDTGRRITFDDNGNPIEEPESHNPECWPATIEVSPGDPSFGGSCEANVDTGDGTDSPPDEPPPDEEP